MLRVPRRAGAGWAGRGHGLHGHGATPFLATGLRSNAPKRIASSSFFSAIAKRIPQSTQSASVQASPRPAVGAKEFSPVFPSQKAEKVGEDS